MAGNRYREEDRGDHRDHRDRGDRGGSNQWRGEDDRGFFQRAGEGVRSWLGADHDRGGQGPGGGYDRAEPWGGGDWAADDGRSPGGSSGGRHGDFEHTERGRDDHRGMFNLGRSRERGGDDREDHREGDRPGFDHRGRGGGPQDARDRGFGSDDHNRGLPMDETSHLIASNKVEGTAVYGGDGRRLGSIHNFMVDKLTGRVEYAVMSYSTGFLGMGTRYYPLPWRVLSYDKGARGYRIDLTEGDLRHAPSFDRESEPQFDRHYGSRVHDYYGLNY